MQDTSLNHPMVQSLVRIAAMAGPNSVHHHVYHHGHAFPSQELNDGELAYIENIQ